MAELTPQEFLDKVLKPEKESDHICWDCKHLKRGLQFSSGRHHRLVQEDPLAALLVRSGLQRGQEVLRLRIEESDKVAWKKTS